MITISLTQGLGNQLFQFFFGEALRLECLSKKIEVNYLYDLLPPDQAKLWEIFNVNINWVNPQKKNKNYVQYLSPQNRKILINSSKFFLCKNFFAIDDSTNFNLNQIREDKDYFFRGYWQNNNYFYKSFEKIKKKLEFKNKIELKKILEQKNIINSKTLIVGVHIRGHDFLRNKNRLLLNNVDRDYYLNYMKILNNIYKNIIFIIFSDDQAYLNKLNLTQDNLNLINISEIIENRIDDFQCLSQCNCLIIPNSTYSLWAFYLNQDINKFILTPDSWFSFKKNIIHNLIQDKYLKRARDLKNLSS